MKAQTVTSLLLLVWVLVLPSGTNAKKPNGPTVTVFITKEKPQHPQQGMDICNGIIFALEDGGYCRVFDFNSRSSAPVASFTLASKMKENHSNCCNFGIETKTGASFPLLYVSVGKPGVPSEWQCHVESISQDGNRFSSELAQTLTLDSADWKAKGYQPIFGCPSWLVDKERKQLWVFSAEKRTTPSVTGAFSNNKYIATCFRIPKLAEGNKVKLTADDILKQVILPFDTYFTQGGCISNGKIYYCFGIGDKKGGILPSRVRVYDTDKSCISERIELKGVINEEMEDLSLIGGKLYANTNSERIYQISGVR